MAYERGFLRDKLTIAKRATSQTPAASTDTGRARYEVLGTFNGNMTFNKGAKSMNEGSMDSYNYVMFRMDYRASIDEWCLIKCQGKWYQIQSLNGNHHDNQLQITAVKLANQNVNIITPTANESENENNVEQ